MNKLTTSQEYACGFFLSEWDENYNFETILKVLRDEIEETEKTIWPCESYEDLWSIDLADKIEDLAKDFEEREQNKCPTHRIVEALHNATSGQQVFDALSELPTDNLREMRAMITCIINDRKTKNQPEGIIKCVI